MEPRLLLAADLIYSEGTPPNTFDPNAIASYAAGLVSTSFTLRAEQDGGNFFWRLYGTGTDILPIPATEVLEYQITQASDLDVNLRRNDNGANDLVAGLGLIDFVGDRLTIDCLRGVSFQLAVENGIASWKLTPLVSRTGAKAVMS